jgi:hypothetical protein
MFDDLLLPTQYQSRPSPDYYYDASDQGADILYQPEIYLGAEVI